ncbi:hypothetical protein AB0M20_21315 [Actinoplanes sp. NPDC051633]|uniref:hypothetical protein n=1 Tax=Actinoplanes sp. NPDC051633 TaxID=3155670 RepID=UPI0034421752
MQSRRYTVTIEGRLGTRFTDAFPGATIDSGNGQTRLVTGPFDQGQLHGLLTRVRDFGLELVSVEPMPDM